MDDLISREKARNEILLLMKDMKLTFGDTTVWEDFKISPTEAANTLRKLPSVDAVEVVRCKDCFYHGDFDENGYCVCECTGAGMPMHGFCSDGERKKWL